MDTPFAPNHAENSSSNPCFRFAAVISHPNQHYSPVFRDLATIPGFRVRAFYGCDHGVRESLDPEFGTRFAWDIPILEGHEYEFLSTGELSKATNSGLGAASVVNRLEAYRPHAMWVHGYGHRVCRKAVAWAQGRCAVLHFGDSELVHHRAVVTRWFKRWWLPRHFRKCDAFVTVGDRNEAYYAHYGVPHRKLFRGACPVDTGRFERAIQVAGRPSRSETRRRWGIPASAVVILMSGKLIPIKRPFDLLEAIALLRERGVEGHALFVGDGPLWPPMQRWITQHQLDDRCKCTGFVNQNEIPLVLEAGDILAVPSEQDAHPLAVAESLIFGHPLVVSDRVGCVGPTDTARPGANAIVYPCGDVRALAGALEQLVRDVPLRQRMGEASRSLAPTQDVSVASQAVLRAIAALRHDFRHAWSEVPEECFRSMTSALAGRAGHQGIGPDRPPFSRGSWHGVGEAAGQRS